MARLTILQNKATALARPTTQPNPAESDIDLARRVCRGLAHDSYQPGPVRLAACDRLIKLQELAVAAALIGERLGLEPADLSRMDSEELMGVFQDIKNG